MAGSHTSRGSRGRGKVSGSVRCGGNAQRIGPGKESAGVAKEPCRSPVPLGCTGTCHGSRGKSSRVTELEWRTHCKKTEHQAPPLRHHGGCSLGSEEGISRCKIFSFLVSLRQQLLLPSAHALRSPGSGSVGPRCVEAGRVEVG